MATAPLPPPTTEVFAAQAAQVGDGFFIQRALPLRGKQLADFEPFLLLDHAGPTLFGPTNQARGVGAHPHKGFQTVTLLYQGDMRHRDSAGNVGDLQPGDVQWMTAGSGIVHEEMHGPTLTQKGGHLELIQLWVNLPAKHKAVAPHYTDLRADTFPTFSLGDADDNFARLIAGQLGNYTGPATTYSPLTLADLYLQADTTSVLSLNSRWNSAIYVLDGSLTVNGTAIGKHFIAKLTGADKVSLTASAKTHLLFLSAAPINEPIASYGPFVMNTDQELQVAMDDYNAGRFGSL